MPPDVPEDAIVRPPTVSRRGMPASLLAPRHQLELPSYPQDRRRRIARRIYQPGAVKGLDILEGRILFGEHGKISSADCGDTIPVWVAAPATATSAGVAGQMAYDGTYLYRCHATNSWGRAAFAAW